MADIHEPRVFAEGALRWVQASGTGMAWTTASAAPTALVGFVQAGTQQTSAQRVTTVMDRGAPKHHKIVGRDAPEITFEFLETVTANDPAVQVKTASGASTPMLHFEIKHDAKEAGASSALYHQFHWGVLIDNQWTEREEGNVNRQTWRFLAVSGANATGYL